MSNIMNYNHGESIATGFVRPKVTSLFFDKIWIPESLLNSSFDFYAIPEEVQIKERNETKIRTTSSKFITLGENYGHASKRNRRYPDEIIVGKYYAIATSSNRARSIDNIESHDLFNGTSSDMFKYSKNRNSAILLSSESFNRKHNLHISPVFHDFTDFEKEAMNFEPQKLYGNSDFRFKIRRPNTFLNKDVLAICIQDFPLVKEEELSWEQVLDFRNDCERIIQLKKFTNWSGKFLKDKTPEQTREILEEELDKYKMALKEHGVKTTISAFSTVVSSASAVASLVTSGDSYLSPLLSITAATISFATNTYFSSYKNRNYPMAYLYNLNKDI